VTPTGFELIDSAKGICFLFFYRRNFTPFIELPHDVISNTSISSAGTSRGRSSYPLFVGIFDHDSLFINLMLVLHICFFSITFRQSIFIIITTIVFIKLCLAIEHDSVKKALLENWPSFYAGCQSHVNPYGLVCQTVGLQKYISN